MNEANGESSRSVNKVSATTEFSAGVLAGAAGLVAGQPFDVVKCRFQTVQYAGRYSSTFSALRAILREERVPGLFKGVTSPMAGIAFINGVVFSSYSMFMGFQIGSNGDEPALSKICLAGAGSGVLASFVACPTELIKIRQQSAPPHLNPSTLSVCRNIVLQDGIRGLYRGLPATALRDLAYGPYFGTYEAVCRYFKSRKAPPTPPSPRHRHTSLIEEAEEDLATLTWPELMTAGGLAGVVAWLVTFPIDVFKTRMQSQSWNGNGNGALSKPSLPRIAYDAIRTEGWKVMFAGLGPTLIRAVPTNMILFLTFEGIVTALS